MFLGIVVFLFLLAIFDLVVGVSNDAVNFMNSAIGAKAASFKTIIAIAATIGLSIRQAATTARNTGLENTTVTAQISLDREKLISESRNQFEWFRRIRHFRPVW